MGDKNEFRGSKQKQGTVQESVPRKTAGRSQQAGPRDTPKKAQPASKSFRLKKPEPRTQKVFGLACWLLAILLFVALISYFLSWDNDQDVVRDMNPGKFAGATNYPVNNWLGLGGAFAGHLLVYNGFGLASFAWVVLLFFAGFRLIFSEHLISPYKVAGNVVFFLLFISVLCAWFSGFARQQPQILGGMVGYELSTWLNAVIGTTGTAFLLVFSAMGWVIYVFNLEIKRAWFTRSRPLEEGFTESEDSGLDRDFLGRKKREVHVFDPGINSPATDPGTKIIHDLDTDETRIVPLSGHANAEIPMTVHRLDEDEQNEGDEPDLHQRGAGITPLIQKSQALTGQPKAPATIRATEADTGGPVLSVERNEIEKKHAEVIEKFGVYDSTLELSSYVYPELNLLEEHGSNKIQVTSAELEANKNKIVKTLENYDIGIDKIKATIGPSVTLYEIIPKAGVRISKIKNLEDDIALNLAALGIRIIAPIPGKGTIGIEVPNLNPDIVSMRSVLNSDKYLKTDMDLPIALGKTISNEVFIADLARMPHLLMAGATGQGKSVGINALLVSLLYKKHPSQLKFVLVDPKKVELTLYRKIERHFLAMLPGEEEAIITDTKKVINTLNSLCIEMDSRYTLLKNAGVRNLKEYNQKFINRRLNPEEDHRFLPFIVLVIDEFADLMMTAGKEIETPIARLAQLARAIGIHLVVATQRPSVNIITGTIKANFPARIAFRVTSKIDSRTILDSSGADQLVGRGDMLLSTGNDLIRLQCAFVDTPEVERITDFIGSQRGYATALQLPEYAGEEGDKNDREMDSANLDPLFKDAARLIVMHQQGSTSLIQRKLQLGYNRAGRIIDQLEQAGIVGKFEGSKARAVLYPDEYSLEQYLESME